MKKPFLSMSLLALAAILLQVSSSRVAASNWGKTERVSVATGGAESDGPSSYPAISANGCYVAFTSAGTNLVDGDTNDVPDVFVYDG